MASVKAVKAQSSFQMIAGKMVLKKIPKEGSSANRPAGGSTKSNDDNQSEHSDHSFTETGSAAESSKMDDLEVRSVLDPPGKKSFFSTVKSVARRGAKAVVRTMLDYGPPYVGGFDVALINECARPVINHIELHNLLNTRINPNLPDPEDLYYTPMHWCARNGHLMGIKMLRRAGGKINVTNEMGVTPLDMIVMMKHSPDRRSLQLKVVQYLLDNGALVNNVDKGGYSAIDHAAVNNDLEIINILLDHGAKLRRDNHILVAKRRPILDLVHDPDCYRTLYEALLVEERDANQKKKERDRIQKLKDEDKYYEKIHVELNKRKLKRDQKEKKEEQALRAETVLAARMELLQRETEQHLQEKEVKKSEQGVWKRADLSSSSSSVASGSSHWKLELKSRNHITGQMIYDTNKDIMKGLQRQNDVMQYNGRWRRLTGGAELEVKWPRSAAFVLPGEKPPRYTPYTPSGVHKSLDGCENSLSSTMASTLQTGPDMFFMDENDNELQDEDDIDDLISELQSL